MKTIVTHSSPDLDAITSVWLIKTFLPGWEEANLSFVPAGTTLHNKPPDENPDIIHVDTGFGKFDHHQTDAYTCASKIIATYLIDEGHIDSTNQEPLLRLTNFVVEDDHFQEVFYPDAESDRYVFLLSNTVRGLKATRKDDVEVSLIVFMLLDGTLQLLKNKIKAEKEIEKGFVFTSYLGKSIAFESPNDEIIGLSQKRGYNLVIRRDPKRGSFRIKTPPKPELNLTPAYQEIIKKDKVGHWFLHASKHMLLNGSSKRPDQKASPLTLQQLIAIVQSI